jgi:hypothetical protein
LRLRARGDDHAKQREQHEAPPGAKAAGGAKVQRLWSA